MAADTVQRIDLKDLDAVLARAKEERWTELALLAGDLSMTHAVRCRNSGWPASRIFILA